MFRRNSLILGVVVLLGWIAIDRLFDLHSWFLPQPRVFFRVIFQTAADGTLFQHLLPTLLRVAGGLGMAIIVGIPLAVVVSRSATLSSMVAVVVDFLRSIPTPVLFPVFIVFFGLGELARVAISTYVAAPILFVGTLNGLRPMPGSQSKWDYCTVNRMRLPWLVRLGIVVWEAAPSIISGLKIAFSTSLVIVTVTEMFFVANRGIGWAAQQAYLAFDVELMYAYIVVIGAVGLSINLIFDQMVHLLKHDAGG